MDDLHPEVREWHEMIKAQEALLKALTGLVSATTGVLLLAAIPLIILLWKYAVG